MTGTEIVLLTLLAQNFEQRGFLENRAGLPADRSQ